jgi:hypothetical protein
VETVVAERLPLTIQLRWMETVKRFLEKSAQKMLLFWVLLEKARKRKVGKRSA